jgi:thiol-disulfide isomerase/thioredoxin
VLGANETDLYFKHDDGLMNVKLKYLSPELQKQFDYDPEKSEKAERQKAEEERRYNESVAQALESEAVQRIRGPATLGEDSLADPFSDKSRLNKPAPELVVEKWIGEKPDVRGKWAIIFFWASSSAPCRRAIPELNALHKKFGAQLVVIGISPENEGKLAQMTEPRIEFFTATDSKGKIGDAAGVTAIPHILLVDPENVVRYQGHPAAVNEKILQKLFVKFAGESMEKRPVRHASPANQDRQ